MIWLWLLRCLSLAGINVKSVKVLFHMLPRYSGHACQMSTVPHPWLHVIENGKGEPQAGPLAFRCRHGFQFYDGQIMAMDYLSTSHVPRTQQSDACLRCMFVAVIHLATSCYYSGCGSRELPTNQVVSTIHPCQARVACRALWHSGPPPKQPQLCKLQSSVTQVWRVRQGLFAPLVAEVSKTELQKAALGLLCQIPWS